MITLLSPEFWCCWFTSEVDERSAVPVGWAWLKHVSHNGNRLNWIRLQLHGAIYRPDSFVLMLRYCANLKAIRYDSTSLNMIVADKSHCVIVARGRGNFHMRSTWGCATS